METNDSPDGNLINEKRNSISRSEINVEAIGVEENTPKLARGHTEPDSGRYTAIKDLNIIIDGAEVLRGILKNRKGKVGGNQNGPDLHHGSGRKDHYGNPIIGGGHKLAWATTIGNVTQVQSYKKYNMQVISRNDCCRLC